MLLGEEGRDEAATAIVQTVAGAQTASKQGQTRGAVEGAPTAVGKVLGACRYRSRQDSTADPELA